MEPPGTTLLKAAKALAEELNFSRAADHLLIDQLTLSRRFMRLEALVGITRCTLPC